MLSCSHPFLRSAALFPVAAAVFSTGRCCFLSSYSNCPKAQFKKQPFREWASSNKTWRYKENDLEPPSSRRWVVNLFTHAEYLPWSSYDMHMHADLLSFPWLFKQIHAGGAAQGSERKACHQCSSGVIIKAVQAFRVWPLMLREAWFSLALRENPQACLCRKFKSALPPCLLHFLQCVTSFMACYTVRI